MGADYPKNPNEKKDISECALSPMAKEGCKFVGVLYAGFMIEKRSGLPKLIEYNVRFGDPECQVLMVRLKSDLAQVLLAASKGDLDGVSLDWSSDSAMVVVMASNGYPGSYGKGNVIQNLEEAEQVAPSVKIFHAGTDVNTDGNFIATGGRVLGRILKKQEIELTKLSNKLTGQEDFTGEISVGGHCLRSNYLPK